MSLPRCLVITSHLPYGQDAVNYLANKSLHADIVRFPTNIELSMLLLYDVVLVDTTMSNNASDLEALGNLLSQYSNCGRGIVVCNYTQVENREQGLSGMFRLHYHPFNYCAFYCYPPGLQLGMVHASSHPIMCNVKTFTAKEFCHHTQCTPANEKVKVIAEWSNGYPLVAERINPFATAIVVGLNMTAASHTAFAGYWDKNNTDGVSIVFNSVVYAARWNRKSWCLKAHRMQNSKILADICLIFEH